MNLMKLSDDLINHTLRYLDSYELIVHQRLNQRFQNLTRVLLRYNAQSDLPYIPLNIHEDTLLCGYQCFLKEFPPSHTRVIFACFQNGNYLPEFTTTAFDSSSSSPTGASITNSTYEKLVELAEFEVHLVS